MSAAVADVVSGREAPTEGWPLGSRRAWRAQAVAFLVYYALYMGYLFARPENELLHWASLVLVPFVLVLLLGRGRGGISWRDAFASVGLRRGNLRRGLPLGAGVGVAVCVLQLAVSDRRAEVWEIVASGRVLYLLPLTIVLMLATAGFTEEFFFRGVVLTRLARWWRQPWIAVAAAALLFTFYHVPYAYLDPAWPSHGHLGAALTTAVSEAGVLGIVLGAVYVWSRGNLLAAVIAHTLINALPAMTLLKFGGN